MTADSRFSLTTAARLCRSMAFMVSCYTPLSHFTADWKFVFAKWQAIKVFFFVFLLFIFSFILFFVRLFFGLRQECIVYMNLIDKCSQADECPTIGSSKISCLLFAHDFVLLPSAESGHQLALNSFEDACHTAGIKTSTAKTMVYFIFQETLISAHCK